MRGEGLVIKGGEEEAEEDEQEWHEEDGKKGVLLLPSIFLLWRWLGFVLVIFRGLSSSPTNPPSRS